MKRFIFLGICLLAPLLGQAGLQDGVVAQNSVIYDEIATISRRAATGSRAELTTTLTRAYPAVTNLAVREAITAVLGLNAMLDRKAADAARYREHLRTTYPKSRYQFLLEPTTNTTACTVCTGKGRRDVPCLTCNGSGKCPRCSGRGNLPRMGGMGVSLGGSGTRTASLTTGTTGDNSSESCIVCKGTGKCKTCEGKKTTEAVCTACQGRGQIPTGDIRPVFTEVTLRLADLAFRAGQIASERSLFDGKWLEPGDFARASRQRREAFDELARIAEDAAAAPNFAVARKTLEHGVAKFPAEPMAWHAQQLLTLAARDEAENRTRASIADDIKLAAASAADQIPARIGAVLDARRRNAQSPDSLLAPDAAATLPVGPQAWQIEAPLVVGRTARASVVMELPMPSGLTTPSRWSLLLIHGATGWRIARIEAA
jgi:hypothetical protein